MKNFKKLSSDPKPVVLVNPVNNEEWHCEDYNDIKNIDGEEFIRVHRPEYYNRYFLMKKSALRLKERSKL